MPPPRACWLALALLLVAIGVAYHNSLDGPFVFDDPLAIIENPTIRRLWPLSDVLFPPRGEGLSVEGRPVLNLTLALNYAWDGTAVRGYHIANTLIHALAALTLFGTLRRAFELPRLTPRFGSAAVPLAFFIALLWALHPLQTESVTYIIQRAESLVSLFYLLTLYGFLRSATSPLTRWRVLTFGACAIGMATKEIMVSAPLLVLLLDRTFIAGTLRDALRQRGRLHAALFATWLLLGALVLSTGTRGGTAGFGINVTPWAYALTQFESVVRYVQLSFWPAPLIFDYGVDWVENAGEVVPYALVLLSLIAATIIAWWRAPAAAWLGILFFAVLSPTSSIVPGNRQTLAEHRMYLPLAAVLTLAACATYSALRESPRRRQAATAAALAAVALCALTIRRNEDYRTELALYRDTAIKRPTNGFARYNLGKVYADAGRHTEAISEFTAATALMPGVAHIHFNHANSLVALGRTIEARSQFTTALQLDPNYAKAHFNLGNLLIAAGDKGAAVEHLRATVRLEPQNLAARSNLGGALLELGELDAAQAELEYVARAQPDSVEAHFGLGNVHLLRRRWADAAHEFERVLQLRPDLAIARERLELARRRR